ncbi:hypothetical protein ATANTOWER_003500 [Ataeniobius toweri]|uniref:Uncharacterized protein n=1 Tax=Ataeniobius toweri TaxID=208326 RepID=A0ABU7BX23_9TELE|nr:hypothetical protein [Ataeniobius toweri]
MTAVQMVQSSMSLEDGTHTHTSKAFMHRQTLLAPNTASVKFYQVLLDNRTVVQYSCHCLISLCTSVKQELFIKKHVYGHSLHTMSFFSKENKNNTQLCSL